MLLGENSDTLHALFARDVQYQVPRYQRRYIWDETNWSMLWEDILAQEKLAFKDRGHFTGNIVTRPIVGGQLSTFEVIDGQQRLATFQIILCVIRDMCISQNFNELADETTRHLVNPNIVVATTSEPDPTYKFLPTEYDKSAFQSIVEGEYGRFGSQIFDAGKVMSHNILNAYGYFRNVIATHVGKDYDENKMRDLINSIKSDFNLIHITLGASDQPEKIFESLNATGRMLSEFDYLRNSLFLRAGQLETGDDFYDSYWCFEDDSRYWNADTLELFFRAFLMAKLGPARFEATNLKLFELYQEYRKTLTNDQDIKYEFQQLQDHAQSYKGLNDISPVSNDSDIRKFGNRMLFYDDLNILRLDSFILFLKSRLALSDTLLHEICDILESYIVRRMLCPDGKDSYAIINTYFSEAFDIGDFCIKEFANNLRETLPDPLKTEEALAQAWSKDVNVILYILYRIELYKRLSEPSSYTQLVFKDFKFRERIALPMYQGGFYAADSIGNIIPLRSEPPERFPLRPFNEKKEFLVEMIAEDLVLSQEIYNNIHWDETSLVAGAIENRAADLLSCFNSIWPEF